METNTFTGVTSLLITDQVNQGRSAAEIVRQISEALMASVPDVKIDVATVAQIGRRSLLSECVGARDAAKHYSIDRTVDPEAVKKATRGGRLIAAKGTGGELRFPLWQFADDGGVLNGLKEILEALRESPAWSDMLPFTFFLNRHPMLSGLRPVDALRKGEIETVLRAARAMRY